jgi:hypothetical protein
LLGGVEFVRFQPCGPSVFYLWFDIRIQSDQKGVRAMGLRDEGNVAIEIEGQTYKGEWKAEKGTITVRYAMETETTHIGSERYPYTALAQQLLSELVQRYKSRAK